MNAVLKWGVSILLYIWGVCWTTLLIVKVLFAALLFPIGSYEPVVIYGCRSLLHLLGFRIEVEGRENIHSGEQYIYMANHVNIFDVFVLGGYLPGIKRGVEAAEHFEWPLWGAMIRRLGNIPIQRENLDAARRSLDIAAEVVKRGISIVILPEGHRTRDGALQQCKKGPFHMAKAAEVPIVPVGLSGMWEVKRYKDPHWRPGRIRVRFGSPIPVQMIRKQRVEELRDLTRDALLKLIDYDDTPRRNYPLSRFR